MKGVDDWRKTIKGRLHNSSGIRRYIDKIKHNIDLKKDSVCIRKNKKGQRILLNVKKDKIYFGISKRLGKSDDIVEQESYFGEVYKIYYPPNLRKSEIKSKNLLAGKVIPLSDEDVRFQFDILSEPWKELIISQQITKHILNKKISPHFSLTYGYFLCKDGNIQDFSNVNIINKMKIRDLIKDLQRNYKGMIKIIDKFDANNRTAIDIINNLSLKIRSLGVELERYEYNVRYPNPQFNIIILMELEDTTLTKLLYPPFKKSQYYMYMLDFHKLQIAKKIKNPFFRQEVLKTIALAADKSVKEILKLETLKENDKNNPMRKYFTPSYIDRIFAYSIIFQIVSAINNLSKLGIAHLDLHVENVLIGFSDIVFNHTWDKFTFWKYNIDGEIYYLIDYGVTCKIGDFGLSETLVSFKKRSKSEKKEFGEFIVDKLAYFVEHKKEEQQIDTLSTTIINNIATQNPNIIFEYLSLFDIIIFLISFIAEIEHISRGVFLNYQTEFPDINIIDLLGKAPIVPKYLSTLKLLQATLFNIFINNMGKRGKLKPLNNVVPKHKNNKYFNLLPDIIDIFHEDNIEIGPNDVIINDKAYH